MKFAIVLASRSPELLSTFYWFLLVVFSPNTGLGLKCYVCSRRENPSYTIDANPSFRIVDNLPRDYCRRLEEVQCDRDHDVCFTVLQYKIDEAGRPPRSYSISKGCYSAPPLGFADNEQKKKRCRQDKVQIKEEIRTGAPVKARRVNMHEAMRHTCICNSNRCNGAASNKLFLDAAVTKIPWHYSNLSSWSVVRICSVAVSVTMTSAMVLLRHP